MFDIKIYIDTNKQGAYLKQGTYRGVLVFTRKNGEKAIRTIQGQEENTTYNRIVLAGVLKALYLLEKECNVTIYTSCKFLINMVEQGTTEKWNRQEWKTAKGEDVKNKDMWQQFMEYREKHNITLQYGETGSYIEKVLREKAT